MMCMSQFSKRSVRFGDHVSVRVLSFDVEVVFCVLF